MNLITRYSTVKTVSAAHIPRFFKQPRYFSYMHLYERFFPDLTGC